MTSRIPPADVGSAFKLWEYRVSHRQLLIRCPKLSENSKNIDLKFYNVEYVDLPSDLPDLKIEDANQDDIDFVSNRLGKSVEKKRVIVLKSGKQRHIVVAGALAISENSMGLFQSPFALPPGKLSKKARKRLESGASG